MLSKRNNALFLLLSQNQTTTLLRSKTQSDRISMREIRDTAISSNLALVKFNEFSKIKAK